MNNNNFVHLAKYISNEYLVPSFKEVFKTESEFVFKGFTKSDHVLMDTVIIFDINYFVYNKIDNIVDYYPQITNFNFILNKKFGELLHYEKYHIEDFFYFKIHEFHLQLHFSSDILELLETKYFKQKLNTLLENG